MINWTKPAFFLALIFTKDIVLAAKLYSGEHKRSSNRALPEAFKPLGVRDGGNPDINIAQGLLRPKEGNRIQYVNELSCDIIHTLETDVNEARIFIDQLRNGTVPTIIANFPQDTFQDLKDLVNILYTLPTEIISSAEAAVTDAASLFGDIEDGAIIKDIENVPSAVVSDITNGWSDLTNEITSAWGDITSEVACLFESCPQPTTARACPVDAAAATTTGAGAAATAGQDTAQGTSQSQAQPTGATNLASTRSKWAGQGVLVTAAVAVFAGSLFL